jgi:hypothetical protein
MKCLPAFYGAIMVFFVANTVISFITGTQFGVGLSARVSVSNSYFDGSLENGTFYTDLENYYANAVITSFPIYYHHTALCSGLVKATLIFNSSAPLVHSSVFLHSLRFFTSGQFSDCAQFSEAPKIWDSRQFSDSAPVSPSDGFTQSNIHTESCISVYMSRASIVRFSFFFAYFFS